MGNISNLNNVHLTDIQITAINEAMTALENALQVLQINLTPEERNRYGRVNEQNKLLINKTYDYATHKPDLRSPDVDWDEFFRDYKSRNYLENLISRLEILRTKAINTKTLHDYDNYQDSLEDYSYTSFRAGSKKVGFEDKYKDIKQFFSKKTREKKATKDNNEEKKDA